MLKFFKKIEDIISHPDKFFDSVKKEKGVKDVFKFYFTFIFLSIMINMIFILPDFVKDNLDIPFLNYVFFVIVTVLLLLGVAVSIALFSFIKLWFYHILIKIFRGKERYRKTYQLLYASTPLLIVILIPFYGMFKFIFYPLFVIAAADSLYIGFVGLQKLQKMKKENAIAVIVTSTLICILLLRFLIVKGVIVL